jgi:hypothetical protein
LTVPKVALLRSYLWLEVMAMAKIEQIEITYDSENDTKIVSVRYDSEPTEEELARAAEEAKCPYPWGAPIHVGNDEHTKGEWWYDVGQA